MILIAVLKIHFLWEVTVGGWANSCPIFERSLDPHFQGQRFFLDNFGILGLQFYLEARGMFFSPLFMCS